MPSLMAWLRPALGPDRDRLTAIIGRLAAAHGAPVFEPHVTMVATFASDEDAAIDTLKSLLADVSPVDVTFTGFGHEQTFFRSLYLRAEPSPQLTALHEAGRRAWALALPAYMPHLSLLYSNLTEEQKRPIVAAIDLRLPLTIHMDAVELWADDRRGVDGWRCVGGVPLGSQFLLRAAAGKVGNAKCVRPVRSGRIAVPLVVAGICTGHALSRRGDSQESQESRECDFAHFRCGHFGHIGTANGRKVCKVGGNDLP